MSVKPQVSKSVFNESELMKRSCDRDCVSNLCYYTFSPLYSTNTSLIVSISISISISAILLKSFLSIKYCNSLHFNLHPCIVDVCLLKISWDILVWKSCGFTNEQWMQITFRYISNVCNDSFGLQLFLLLDGLPLDTLELILSINKIANTCIPYPSLSQ